VALEYAQANRPYCWGGKGYAPCAGNPAIGYVDACRSPSQWPCFDCSGLSYIAYLEGANTVIGHGTANQQNYPSVAASAIQPGDLMLFGGINQHGRGSFITHVGVYGGDVTGDGTGDLIHAANYPDGVIVTNNVLGNSWYRQRLAIITRPPLRGERS
jgi:cell wall-associated NlpC family hydrolase